MFQKCKTKPGKTFEHCIPQIKAAMARSLQSEGVTCELCSSAIHHEYIPFEYTQEQIDAPYWSDIHEPMLNALESARSTSGLCKYHHLAKVDLRPPEEMCSSHGCDIEKKQQLYVEMMGPCNTCRRPHTAVGFHFNHREPRWEGDGKKFNIADFFVDWVELDHAGDYTKADDDKTMRNFECLAMPYAQAEPLMRAEAAKCTVECVSCHQRITQDQLTAHFGTCYDWPEIKGWIKSRITTSACAATAICINLDEFEI